MKKPALSASELVWWNTHRVIDIHEGEDVNATAFKALVRQAIALNGSGRSKPSGF
jgi:hypothetical protein